MDYEFTESFAKQQDDIDELSVFRNQFHIPLTNGHEAHYFTGNSLGLQPKETKETILEELNSWAKNGVEGYFRGERQWLHYHKYTKEIMATLVGANKEEVVIMNSLTVNLHLLMVSFYKPTTKRYKILMEAGAFPSDQYAVESQVKFHGYDPAEAIIELIPRNGEDLLAIEDIVDTINKHADELALILMGGVQYFTGQLFDMKIITETGQAAGAKVGFDLAHAVGNVPLQLHDWGVDFAVWCTYKYLNSGPGSVAGAFVNQQYANNQNIPRFAGWWGYNEETRFMMQKGFIPMTGADGWQLSNGNVLSTAAILTSLQIFNKVGLKKLRAKSIALTGYAEYLINLVIDNTGIQARIITPENPNERGCQLSLAIENYGKEVFNYLFKHGIMADWREADQESNQNGIIRLAPVPLYNTFKDVYEFASKLEQAIRRSHV